MIQRLLILSALLPLLAACGGSGNPAYYSKAGGAGPYDLSDKFLDEKGFPLPGWAGVRDGTGGSGSGAM